LWSRRRAQSQQFVTAKPPESIFSVPPEINTYALATEDSAILPALSDFYNIQEVLGQGTTGVVYRGIHIVSGRQVALKTVRTDDVEMLRIAKAEFELISAIRHPKIIQALDFFVATGRIVMVLEFFDGTSLARAIYDLPGRRATEAVAHGVFVPLLQAISYLHARRIVHRDVKGDNVLVSSNFEDLRLVDFNTAKRLAEGGSLTITGTRLYAAPEVLLGDSPSEGSDVWALGLCLHLMLAGKLPVHPRSDGADYNEFVSQVTTKPVSFIGRKWRGVSDRCKATLGRCLEVKKDLRPASLMLLEDDWVLNGPGKVQKQNCATRHSSQATSPTVYVSNESNTEAEKEEHPFLRKANSLPSNLDASGNRKRSSLP
jgi:serine/threonine protein kinase